MPKTASHRNSFWFLNKTQLTKLKLKAVRAGVWFRALPRIDRALLDLTIRVASSVRSTILAMNILAIAKKLEGLLESSLLRAFREIGVQLAQKLSSIAQKWGYNSANSWASDMSFIKFLAIMHINGPKAFKT